MDSTPSPRGVPTRTIRKVLGSHLADLQGAPISRALPSGDVNQVSPFLLLDHIGPVTQVPGRPFTVEEHPHRGFEPVTFLFEGRIEHRDSSGGRGLLEGGDVQWMTAGSGVIHREGVPDDYATAGGRLHAVQLWVNLPGVAKMSPPRYQDIKAAHIPVIEGADFRLRLIAGRLADLSGPAETHTPMLIVHGAVRGGGYLTIPVPDRYNAVLYVTAGSVRTSGQEISVRWLAWFHNNGPAIHVYAPGDSEFLVLAGEPIDEPLAASGPFVMNTPDELARAAADYESGRMGRL